MTTLPNIEKSDLTQKALSVQTVGNIVRLTKGQKLLLEAIRDCVANGKPMDYPILVDIFYKGVSQHGSDYNLVGDWGSPKQREWYKYDIMEEYELNTPKWQYRIKPRVRQWFVSTIGILVVKNQLIIIPTIEI